MGARAAHRKAAALQMARRHLQNAVAGAVVNGQLHADLGDGDVPHDAGTGDVEGVGVAAHLFGPVKGIGRFGQPPVVVVGGVKIGLIVHVRQVFNLFRVARHSARLVFLVDIVTDGRI